MDSEQTFGESLRLRREAQGIGRRAIHKAVGLSLSYQHDVENDEFLPGEENTRAYARAIGVPEDELLAERDRAYFERLGLDGHTAVLLKALGRLSEEERDSVMQILQDMADQRRWEDAGEQPLNGDPI